MREEAVRQGMCGWRGALDELQGAGCSLKPALHRHVERGEGKRALMDGIRVLLARLNPDAFVLAVRAEGEEFVGVVFGRTNFQLCGPAACQLVFGDGTGEGGRGEVDCRCNGRIAG